MISTPDFDLASSSHSNTTAPRKALSETVVDEMTKQKIVRFSDVAVVRCFDPQPVLRRKASLWYTEEEVARQLKQDVDVVETIRQKAIESSISPEILVEAVNSVAAKSGSHHQAWDIRGLESLLDDGEQKARNRLQAALAVLMEQDRQDMEREQDVQLIAMRYQRATETSIKSALKRAEQDRSEIHETNKLSMKDPAIVSSLVEFSKFLDAPTPVWRIIPSRAA